MLRNYEANDFIKCVEIINDVWDFDNRFKPEELSELFKKVYAGGSLAASNYAVVVEEEGVVKGFLFGKCGEENIFGGEYAGFKGSLRFLKQLFLVRGVSLKKKLYYLRILGEHEKNRREVESKRENEVNLFAVTSNTQGKGFGKLLMNSFINECKSKKVTRVTLDTDKECNYGFYDHFGFKVKGEFYSPLQKEYSGKSGESYVYELLL
jgi:GNAT superfamily N-acetyltransferase